MRKESEIQRGICEYLFAKGYFFTRMNNTPIFDPTRKRFRAMTKYALKGFPDILVLYKGKAIGIEVKTDTGKLSKEQRSLSDQWVNNGGAYFIARSIDDVQKWGL